MSGTLPERARPLFPEVLRKVVVTAVAGGSTYVITNLARQERIWSVMLSVLIGGIALLVQFLAQVETRLRHVEEGQIEEGRLLRTAVEERFRAISEATALFGLIEESAVQTDLLSQLVRNAGRFNQGADGLIARFAHGELTRFNDFMKELGEGGEVTYDGEDRDWLLGLTRSAARSIHATSLTTVDAGEQFLNGGLWDTDLGQRYLDAQREAAQRGVEVRRVFILDRPDIARTDEFAAICRLHATLGIEVRILNLADAAHLRRTSVFDFILFDDVLSYELTTGSWMDENARPVVVNTRLVLRRARVDERAYRFTEIWDAAEPLDGRDK
jgi:uncharacterized protein DUF6879